MPEFKFIIRRLILLLFLFCIFNLRANAQACDPAVDPFCSMDPDSPDVPLDDHVVYLMAAGLVIGTIYLRKQNANKI